MAALAPSLTGDNRQPVLQVRSRSRRLFQVKISNFFAAGSTMWPRRGLSLRIKPRAGAGVPSAALRAAGHRAK